MSKRLSANDMRQALKEQMDQQEQLKTSTGTGNPMPTSKPGDFDGRAIIRLKVRDVGTYERNPRTLPNEKRDEIKESILDRGLDQSLAVTKRPGSDRYVLAKGGNTRLSILWELAEEYPDRFTSLDFDLVEFTVESRLMVGHMSENLTRSAMCFWDTANSYLELRKIRSQELGRDISHRDFSVELKQQGLKADSSALRDFEFIVSKLSPLGDLAKKLGRSDVPHKLRPQHSALHEVRSKLLESSKSANSLDAAYAEWLQAIAAQKDELTGADGETEFDVNALNAAPTSLARNIEKHIAAMAATWFGLTEAELSACVQAISADRTITAAKLQSTLEQLRSPQATSAASTTVGNDGDESGAYETDTSGVGTGSYLEDSEDASGGHANNDDNDNGAYTYSEGPVGVTDADSDVPTGRVPSALNGVKTAPEHMLTRIPNPGTVDGQNNNGAAQYEGSADPAGEQGQLPGTTSLEMAVETMRSCIMDLTDYASLTPLLRNAPGMPLGYFMDAPASSLGVSAGDFAAQAWWLLATMSGQLTVDWFQHQVTNEHGATDFAIFDTGPSGFRARAEDQDGWMQFVQTHLGGTYQADGYYTLELLTDLSNPVGEFARELVKAVGTFRLLSQQELN